MSHLHHELVLADFTTSIQKSQTLVRAAHQWSLHGYGPTNPRFTSWHRRTLIEFSFLRSFLAWESFLEATFVLYLIGKKPARRRHGPRCYFKPKNRKHALQLLLPETGRKYVDWDELSTVLLRSKRVFEDGEPFDTALSPRLNMFEQMHIVRNAVAHRSESSQLKFQKLVRDKHKYLPSGITVGDFLDSVIPSTTPPITQLDFYVDGMSKSAGILVPV
jgi:hypothetical protein